MSNEASKLDKFFSYLLSDRKRSMALAGYALDVESESEVSAWMSGLSVEGIDIKFCETLMADNTVFGFFTKFLTNNWDLSNEEFEKACDRTKSLIINHLLKSENKIAAVVPIAGRLSREPEQPRKQPPPGPMQSIQQQHPQQQIQPNIQQSVMPLPILNTQKSKTKISAQDIQIIVNYEGGNVNMQYTDPSLKLNIQQLLAVHINKSLQKVGVDVLQKRAELEILDDEVFMSHAEAGNYFFDPFHKCIQIYAKLRNGDQFTQSFLIDGEVPNESISWNNVTELKKKTESLIFKPKDSINKLVEGICRKKGEPQNIEAVINAFRNSGGVQQIQDLFYFEEKDIKALGLQNVYAHEIYELVQKSKGMNEMASKQGKKVLSPQEQKEKELKKDCLKTGTSHKILRYLVYKTEPQQLASVPLVSYKNMKKAVEIVKEVIVNDKLWEQLQRNFFFQFCSSNIGKTSYGMILYGPPGTGKTQITERLPELIGFHLIDEGKSAADFSTSYVGQTKRMLEGLVDRARISPYIQCSIGIDEVDGLIPDRKDKKEGKSNNEGISILLSLVGGNKTVSNLVFLTSTNHLKKIDEAMLRRFSGQYQVGRPGPVDREKIVRKYMDAEIKGERIDEEFIKTLKQITSNFTGAAMGELIRALKLELELQIKDAEERMQDTKRVKLYTRELTAIASIICSQFKVKLGMYALPQIMSEQYSKQNACNLQFFSTIVNQFAILRQSPSAPNTFQLNYATGFRYNDVERKTIRWIFEKNEETFKVSDKSVVPNMPIQTLENWIKQSNAHVIVDKVPFSRSQSDLMKMMNTRLRHRQMKTFLIVDASNSFALIRDLKLGQESRVYDNLFILYFIGAQSCANQVKELGWMDEKETQHMKPFTGRIFVELKENPKMDFELKRKRENETPLYERTFMRSDNAKNVNDIVPELVNFFTERNLNSIFLLDYNTLMDNDAFQDQKQLEIVREKVEEAINYTSVALIIEADSLINVSKNLSESSMGPSSSYSITNHNMAQFLTSILKSFAMVEEDGKERWVSVVAKDKFLIDMLKEAMTWPESNEDRKRKQREEEDNRKRRCKRCHAEYTRKDNQEEKKCMQHPGFVISTKEPKFMPVTMGINEIRSLELVEKNRNEKKASDLFVFACCSKGLNEQGEKAYQHIEEGDYDELMQEMRDREDEWNKILNIMKSSKRS